jgi:hypothetical protein
MIGTGTMAIRITTAPNGELHIRCDKCKSKMVYRSSGPPVSPDDPFPEIVDPGETFQTLGVHFKLKGRETLVNFRTGRKAPTRSKASEQDVLDAAKKITAALRLGKKVHNLNWKQGSRIPTSRILDAVSKGMKAQVAVERLSFGSSRKVR